MKKKLNMNLSSKDDSSSVLEIADLQIKHFPGTGKAGEEKIKIAPLSNLLDKSELIYPVLLN